MVKPDQKLYMLYMLYVRIMSAAVYWFKKNHITLVNELKIFVENLIPTSVLKFLKFQLKAEKNYKICDKFDAANHFLKSY